MVQQEGLIRITGNIGNATYYKVNGEYRVRLKSSLTGKRFWHDKRFAHSRESCRRFAAGNHLASKVYRFLPKEKRGYPLFCQLKTAAIHYLKLGLTTEEAYPLLVQQAHEQQFFLPTKIKRKKPRKAFPYAVAITKDYVALTAGRYMQLVAKYGQQGILDFTRNFFKVRTLYPASNYYQLAIA